MGTATDFSPFGKQTWETALIAVQVTLKSETFPINFGLLPGFKFSLRTHNIADMLQLMSMQGDTIAVIGSDIFKAFRTVVLDYQQKIMWLQKN